MTHLDADLAAERYNPDTDTLVEPCRCPRGNYPCIQRVTQEDMRCDTCRAGCIQTTVRDTAGNEATIDHCSRLLT
jgi:hypothetical protein